MSRVRPVLGALFALALVAAACVAGPAGAPTARAGDAPKPNVVLILTDDQRFDTIGRCLNGFDPTDYDAGTDACMPNLQSLLMANGSTFQRGYVTTSLCCPSRSTILSGRYARHHGVTTNNDGEDLDDANTLPVWLDAAGYRTGLYGKYLNGYGYPDIPKWPAGYVPPGWDSFHAFTDGQGYTDYDLTERDPGEQVSINHYALTGDDGTGACAADNDYSTDRLCELALRFLNDPSTDPFFLFWTPASPHAPYEPPARWQAYANQVTIPPAGNLNKVATPNTPAWMNPEPLTAGELATQYQNFRSQLAMNRAVDDAIGRFNTALTDNGKLANTVWVFLGDNGYAHGHHRLVGKNCEMEECHRVPFVVACPPAVCPGAVPDRVVQEALVLNLDLAPTIVELAGATPTVPLDGRSLMPLLSNPAAPWREAFVMEDRNLETTGVTAWGSDGHLWSYAKLPQGQQELYDLDVSADPWQLQNLWKDPDSATELADMQDRLAALTTPPVVTFTLTPPPTTAETDADFAWSSSEPADFTCALDDAVPTPCGNDSTTGSRSFAALPGGPHRFSVSGTDPEHNPGPAAVYPWMIGESGTPPNVTLTRPGPTDLLNGPAVKVTWTSSDDQGIARHDVYERAGGPSAARSLVASTSPTVKTYSRSGTQGTTYCYDVTAVDVGGNSTTSGSGCAAVPLDDVSLQPFGAVDRLRATDTYLSTVTKLNAAGEELRATVTGRRLGVLVKRTSSSGKLQLWLDGAKVATIDLYSATTKSRVYVGVRSMTAGPHVVRLVWDGGKNASSSGRTVLIDGLGVVT